MKDLPLIIKNYNLMQHFNMRDFRLLSRTKQIFPLGCYAALTSAIYRRFGQAVVPSSTDTKNGTDRPLKMGPISCPETSVSNYQSTPRNISDDGRYRHYYLLNSTEDGHIRAEMCGMRKGVFTEEPSSAG